MRTKALLLGAAIGAATILPSMAQVFSVNIVGYVNVNVASNWTLVANPLNATGGNAVTNVWGFPAKSITLYKYDNVKGYIINNYTSSKKSWNDAQMSCNPGEGMWVKNPNALFTQTFVGEVPTGEQTVAIGAGFNLISSKIPQTGLIQTDLGYTPSTTKADTVYKWDSVAQTYLIFPYSIAKKTWSSGQPTINPADGFWLLRGDTGTYNWTRTFNVQ